MKMNKRFIASIIRSAKSEAAPLPWAAARRGAGRARSGAAMRKLG